MEAKSLGDMLRRSCRTWPDKVAMLYPVQGGAFAPVTYRQLEDRVRRQAAALRSLGLKKGDRIALQSESCIDWAYTDWACYTLGITLIPIYPTLPADQSQYIVKDSGALIVFSSTAEQAEKVQEMPGIRSMLLKGPEGTLEALAEEKGGTLTVQEWEASIDSIKPEDLATIIYTSGTTGHPKGAMLAHRSLTFICEQALQSLPIGHTDTFLSFLPMSHVYERVAGQALPISIGGTIAFAKSLMTLSHDMQEVKPTILLCVPRFLEATRDRIIDTTAKGSFVKKILFKWALSQGSKKAKGQLAPFSWLLDPLVGKRIRGRTGGRIRLLVSGGAALAPHVAEFYQAFGLTVLQGYGLTETTAATCLNHPDRNKPWTVGEPIPGVEVKIASDGEILIRGPSRMIGYYNLPDATAEAIDSDGWFHSGDIGEFEGKHLKITDRKKDLLILANGKNIAPQPIENKIRESHFINDVVLFGDRNEFVYGLVLPNWERIEAELKIVGTRAELAERDDVKALIKREMDKVNRTLADFERVKRYAIITATFSVDTGELTPSLKVKRKVVRQKYASILDTLGRPETD